MRSSSAEPYLLVLVAQARRELERLELDAEDKVLRVLESELQSRAPDAEQIAFRGETFLRTPVGSGLDAIYRELTPEESPTGQTPAFGVFALVPHEVGR